MHHGYLADCGAPSGGRAQSASAPRWQGRVVEGLALGCSLHLHVAHDSAWNDPTGDALRRPSTDCCLVLQVAFIERKGLRKILNLDEVMRQCNGLPLGHGRRADCDLVSFDADQDFPDVVRLLQDMDVLVRSLKPSFGVQGAISFILGRLVNDISHL